MQNSFNSLEADLMMHTTLLMDQIYSFEDTIIGKLNAIICNQHKFDIYPNLRHLQTILDKYSNSNAIQKELRLKDTVETYRTEFENVFVRELLRALKGDPSPVTPSKSLVEIEMECYHENHVCSDKYHEALRYRAMCQVPAMVILRAYMQFEKLNVH